MEVSVAAEGGAIAPAELGGRGGGDGHGDGGDNQWQGKGGAKLGVARDGYGSKKLQERLVAGLGLTSLACST